MNIAHAVQAEWVHLQYEETSAFNEQLDRMRRITTWVAPPTTTPASPN